MKRSFWRKSLLWASMTLLAAGFFATTEVGAQVTQITVTGAGKGAWAYVGMAAVTEAVNRSSKTVQVTNRESGGFVEGTRLVGTNRVQIAMSNGPFVDSWQRKKEPFVRDTGSRDTIRGVGPSSVSFLHVAVLKDSGIKTFMDLKGKRVNLGPKGSNANWMIGFSLKAAGIFDTVRQDSLGFSDAATYVVDRKLDAFGIPNPLPSPAVLQASYSAPVRVLDLPDVVINKFIEFSPGYHKEAANCRNLYKGMENQSFTSIAYMIMLVAHKDVPDDIVYEVVRHTYDPKNHDLMVNIAKGWGEGLERGNNSEWLGRLKSAGVKLHPGAARYWKEKGMKVD